MIARLLSGVAAPPSSWLWHNSLVVGRISAALRRVPLLAALPPALFEEVAGLSTARRVRRGELVFSEGDPARFLPLLLVGRLKLSRSASDGREQVLHLVRAPASFAEAAVFGPGVFPATAVALEDGELATIARQDLLDLLRRRTEIALALLASLAIWLRRLADLVEGLALRTVEERVAAYLWSAFRRVQPAPAPGSAIRLELPKQTIAAVCGTAPAVLSRTFRRLGATGVVTVSGRAVILLDPAALAALAAGAARPDR